MIKPKTEMTLLFKPYTIQRLDDYQKYNRPDTSMSCIIEDLILASLNGTDRYNELDERLSRLEDIIKEMILSKIS